MRKMFTNAIDSLPDFCKLISEKFCNTFVNQKNGKPWIILA